MPAPNQLLVDLFVIFAVTKCFGEIFERFSLPAVLGEILAGITDVAMNTFAMESVLLRTQKLAKLGKGEIAGEMFYIMSEVRNRLDTVKLASTGPGSIHR